MANILRSTAPLQDLDNHVLWDDFTAERTDLQWIDTIADGGTAEIADGANGIMTLSVVDSTDNDEVYLESAVETFLVAANRSLYFRTRIQFTEINTDDANIAVGFANAPGADLIIDDGAGLKTTGNWFSIYKVDGETVWRANCRNSTATGAGSALGTLSNTTAGGASYQVLEIFINDFDGTNVEVLYKVDGQYLTDSNNLVIRHRLAISGSTEMAAFFGAKSGGANPETLNIDYCYASQNR